MNCSSSDNSLGERIGAVLKLLAYAPLRSSDSLLDIGIGAGEITMALAARVGRIVGTGLNFSSYGPASIDWHARGIRPVECVCEALPFPSETFDVVVMSHILEHTPNVGWALGSVHRVLRSGGLLCLFVPPSEPVVAGGHVSMGWNIGQVMYVLALNGFDVHNGNFVEYGYNVCAFVRRDDRPLPPLRHDLGDIAALAADQRWPLPIQNENPAIEAFDGDLRAVNWPWIEILASKPTGRGGRWLRGLIPKTIRLRMGRWLQRLGGALVHDPEQVARDSINPKYLHYF